MSDPMQVLGLVLMSGGGLCALGCFFRVLAEMRDRGKKGLRTACVLLFFIAGIGLVVAFVYGWVKHREWKLTKLMTAFTVCLIVGVVGEVLLGVLHP